MKMVIVAYNEALEGEVMSALEERGLANYTKWTDVLGKGESSGPHLGTTIWPKRNLLILAAVDDAVATGTLEAVRRLRGTVGSEGIKAFILPLEEMT